MPRIPKPFLSRGAWITTAGGKQTRLATAAEGEEVAKKRLAELLAGKPPAAPSAVARSPQATGPTLRELLTRYMTEHVTTYYRLPSGEPSSEVEAIPLSCRELLAVAGDRPAAGLTSETFEQAQLAAVAAGLSRKVINQRWGRVRQLLKWSAKKKLIPVAVLTEASLVESLPANRSAAAEHDDIEPVDVVTVAATLRHLAEPWASMARLQWVTGMRPGEVVSLRASYFAPVGRMRLIADFGKAHKMAYRGKPRRVAIGEGGAMILSRWLGLALLRGDDYLFPSKKTRGCVRRRSYERAIETAAADAGVPHWHPNQLRHAFATRVREKLGLDAAQAALGHAKADVTQVYAKITDEKILRISESL